MNYPDPFAAPPPCPDVAAAIEFAKRRGWDCSALVTFVALKETGMLATYLKSKDELPLEKP